MYVCLCYGITDKDIKNAVKNGASSLRDIRYQLNVATQCGKCASHAKAVIREAVDACRQAELQGLPLFYPACA